MFLYQCSQQVIDTEFGAVLRRVWEPGGEEEDAHRSELLAVRDFLKVACYSIDHTLKGETFSHTLLACC